MLVDTLIDSHRLHIKVSRQERYDNLIGRQFRLFQETFLITLKKMAGEDMYRWRTPVSPLDDETLGAVVQHTEVA